MIYCNSILAPQVEYKLYLLIVHLSQQFIYLFIKMSSINVFQKYQQLEDLRTKITVNNNTINAILDYLEYAIRIQFNQSDKTKAKNKNRKKQIAAELAQAFTALSREQKVEYYVRVVECMRSFTEGKFDIPQQIYTGIINDIGYSRSFNVKRWKEKKLRLDQDRHILYAEREVKIKSYDLKNYILRRSKNKEYFCFVLEAINNTPPQKSKTVHIGFTDQSKFQIWFRSISFSVQFKQWEWYLYLFKGSSSFRTIPERMYTTDDLGYNRDKQNVGLNYSARDNRSDDVDNDLMSKSLIVVSNKVTEFVEEKRQNVQVYKLGTQQRKEKQKLEDQIKKYQQKIEEGPKTLVDGLIEDVFEEPETFQDMVEDEGQASINKKKHLDLFHKLYPQYELSELQSYSSFEAVYSQAYFKIYQNSLLEKRFKMVVIFQKEKFSQQKILYLLAKPQNTLTINDNLQEVQIKTNIPSQNSALVYQVLKPFNRLYRPRDFIFIRHVFNEGKKLYMIDKSIQNSSHPPFMTIVRGQLCIVYGIFDRQDHFQLIADLQMTNEGYISPVQETNLTMKFIKAFSKLPTVQPQINSYKFFDLDWDISKNQANSINNQIRMRRRTINQLDRKIHEKEDMKPKQQIISFSKKNSQVQGIVLRQQDTYNKQKTEINQKSYSSRVIDSSIHSSSPNVKMVYNFQSSPQKKVNTGHLIKSTVQEVGEISAQDGRRQKQKLQTQLGVIRELDQRGYVIINGGFRKNRYITEPLQSVEPVWMQKIGDHPIWKGEWRHDKEDGGIIFINEKKIEDQKGVLKFVLTKIAKNLLSGQSILNISLPVDIFSPESNIQRFLYSMLYAPQVLDHIQNESLLNKLIKTIVFGISNSILYLSMEKPFNPILGQTFQCWINGCPAYAEQISHHPPIAALMLKGRGYEVTAQLESKVSLALNSGTGSNDGVYRVTFADKSVICFVSPGGEISGLTHGDRKFNLVGKSYYWISQANIVLELVFNPFKKGIFSMSKQQQPSDYYEGTIWEVTPKFMSKFQTGKRKQPDEKDRVRELGKISGFWEKSVCFNGEEVFNFDRQYPYSLQYEPFPLPSDANWREDIEYRRRNQTTRAQAEKERLQTLQRKDRKLRQKYRKQK